MDQDPEHAEDAYLRAARELRYPLYPGTAIGTLPMQGRWFLGIRRIRAEGDREYVEIQSWRYVHPTGDHPVRTGRQRLVFPVEHVDELIGLLREAAARDIGKPAWSGRSPDGRPATRHRRPLRRPLRLRADTCHNRAFRPRSPPRHAAARALMDSTTEIGLAIGGLALGVTVVIVGLGAILDWLLRRR